MRQALGVAALLPFLLAPQLPAEEGVLLAPRFAAGERVRYRMTLTVQTRSKLEPLGTSATDADPLRVAFDIVWQMEALSVEPEGSVQLRAIIESIQIESAPPPPRPVATDQFVGKAVTYRVTGDGRIESIQAPPEWLTEGRTPAWLRQWLEQGVAGGEVPREAIRPGESWTAERTVEVEGLPRQQVRSTSTYVRDERVGERSCAAIVTRLETTGTESRQEKSPDGTTAAVSSRIEGAGSRLSCYDLSNGHLLESTQTTEETYRLEVRRPPAAGQKGSVSLPALRFESHTTIESHLRVVE